MRVPSGSTDRYAYFVALDSTDLKTRETGLATWTVYRSRNGAASAVMTTPTINETDVTNMPGVYELLIDEDTTIAAGNDEEEMVFHITHTGMAPVTRTIELFRPKITEGQTVTAANGAADADIERLQGNAIATPTVSGVLEVDVTHLLGTAWLAPGTAGTPDVNVKLWNALTTVALPLAPTVAGRTLDVSVGGEAGVDWANVGTPGSTVSLSATTVNLVTTVTTLTNLPAITANWLTAAGLAADAVTEIQAGLSTLDAAGVRSAVGLVSANLDTQLSTIDDFLDTEVTAIKTQTDKLTFTVSGQVDANIQYVNDIQVTGVGTTADPWGP